MFSRALLAILLAAGATAANAQEIENRHVVVQAETEELPSAYGAPPDLSHGRISTLTKSYVLSPFSFELEAGYEGAVFHHGLPSQPFRQEIEMGLPARFTVGRYLRRVSVWPQQRIARFGRACAPDLARFSSPHRVGDEHLCGSRVWRPTINKRGFRAERRSPRPFTGRKTRGRT